jgi:hypothetical protein
MIIIFLHISETSCNSFIHKYTSQPHIAINLNFCHLFLVRTFKILVFGGVHITKTDDLKYKGCGKRRKLTEKRTSIREIHII